MPDTIFSEKRTRSQITLPDDILQVSQRSPLKDARSAVRNYTIPTDTRIPTKGLSDDATDDELLLSPRKDASSIRIPHRSKRSASPPPENGQSPRSSLDERDSKRIKRDASPERINIGNTDIIPLHPTLMHVRNHSEPNYTFTNHSSRKMFKTASNKPASSDSQPCPPTPGPSGKERAQSVPLFSTSYPIPHIDLKNPPPSPHRIRARSRSPSKEREPKLRITSLTLPPVLGSIPDESLKGMEVDDPSEAEQQRQPHLLTGSESTLVNDAFPTPDIVASSASPEVEINRPEPPSTPATGQGYGCLDHLSPLTPLPVTPHPSILAADAKVRFTGRSGWDYLSGGVVCLVNSSISDINIGTEKLENTNSLPAETLIPLEATLSAAPSLVEGDAPARPSQSGNMGPPAPVPPNRENRIAVGGNRTGKGNALLELMKGQAKSVAESSKANTLAKKESKMKGKGKQEEEKPKPKLKARMRPKPKIQPKPVPLFVPITTDEDAGDTEPDEAWKSEPDFTILKPPLPRLTSPVGARLEGVPANEAESAPENVAELVLVDSAPLDERPQALVIENDVEQSESTAPSAPELVAQPGLAERADPVYVAQEEPTPHPKTTAQPTPKPRTSKLPLGKKVVAPAMPRPSRVTRSVSSKQRATSSSNLVQQKLSMAPPSRPLKRTASGAVKPLPPPQDSAVSSSSLSEVPTDPISDFQLPPGSPMKLCSPGKSKPKVIASSSTLTQPTRSSAAKMSLTKTPAKTRTFNKPVLTPSPTKVARSASMLSSRPTLGGVSRTFSVNLEHSRTATGGSSLSTLASALEKLRMPPPARPNTTMGFNRDSEHNSFDGKMLSMDDGALGRPSLGVGRPESGKLKRSATVGSLMAGPLKKAVPLAGFSKDDKASKPVPALPEKPGFGAPRPHLGAGAIMRGGKQDSSNKPRIFGFGVGGRRVVQKASRKPSLPSVVASPIKGGEQDPNATIPDYCMHDAGASAADSSGDVFLAPSSEPKRSSDLPESSQGKGKEKESTSDSWLSNASRRVSMASQALSQSLSSLPPPTIGGLMGPPATPPGRRGGVRSSSSSYPSTSGASSGSPTNTSGTRSSARIAKAVASGLMQAGKKAASESPAGASTSSVPDSLKILKDCVIFVDVRTDDGDEAGSLFVEMLESVGAKTLTRVGQTCTHVVFKNGLMSTVTRHRLLRDPKPLVVGIAWVVECVEQRQRVDETNFLIDLEEVNLLSGNKRRRSMLPKPIVPYEGGAPDMERDGDGDQSMDGSSSSSMIIDDDLPPLERARRRKSMLVGPRP